MALMDKHCEEQMAPPKYKTLERRLVEAQEVRAHLQRIGALQNPTNRELVTRATNAFMRDGTGTTLRLRLDDDTRVILLLCARVGTKSGVTLEHC